MKKIIAFILSLVMVMCLSVPAFAEDDAGSFSVTYNVESSYLINLPDITLTEGANTFDITADYVHIEPGKHIAVSIDPDRTLTNGYFYLFKDGGTDLNTAMRCDVYVSSTTASYNKIYEPYWISDTGLLGYPIALFYPEDTTPKGYGHLSLTPQITANNAYGSYVGNIYYTIKIE